MAQWRGMRPPGAPIAEKSWGLTPPPEDAPSQGGGIDRAQLAIRGWTPALITKHLGDRDWRDPVDHWANFTGKDVFLLARVELAEGSEAFAKDFAASAKRRKLSADVTAEVLERCERLRKRRTVVDWEALLRGVQSELVAKFLREMAEIDMAEREGRPSWVHG